MRFGSARDGCARRAGFILALGLCVCAGFASAQRASAGAVESVLVAPPIADEGLGDVAEGVGFWLEERLHDSGARVAAHDRSHRGRDAKALARLAVAAGIDAVASPRLRHEQGQIEVVVALREAATQSIVAVVRARAPLGEIGLACNGVAERLLNQLGIQARAQAPPALDGLAATGRAVRLFDAKRPHAAWQEVAGKLSPTAARARDVIAAAASDPNSGSLSQRARVMAAAGKPEIGWNWIREAATRKPPASQDSDLLIAAAEVRFEQNQPRDAKRYLDALLAREPGHADAQLLVSQLHTLRGDDRGARQALALAVRAGANRPKTLERLARLESDDPRRSAEFLMRAGDAAAKRLDPHRAGRLLDRAATIEPTLQASSWRVKGRLEERLGNPSEALSAYEQAASAGAPQADVQRGIGRAQWALGNLPGAESAFERALEIEPNDSETLRDLGDLRLTEERTARALPALERAVALQPSHTGGRRALSRALRTSGRPGDALAVLEADDGEPTPENLAELARVHRELGDVEKARFALLGAVELAPLDAGLQRELSAAHAASGDEAGARVAHDLAKLLEGATENALELAFGAEGEGAETPALTLDEFVDTFTDHRSTQRRVVHLGIRAAPGWRALALDWLHPRRPDRDGIEASLERAISERFSLVRISPETVDALTVRFDPFYDFESPESLDALEIASMNELLGSDALFVSRLDRLPAPGSAGAGGGCPRAGDAAIEVRMLGGAHPEIVAILNNIQCVPNALESGAWNVRAFVLYGFLALFLVYPLVRGWGNLVVQIQVPPHTKGFFSIRISKTENAAPVEDKKKRRTSERLQRSLRSLSRYERRMAGRESTFRWLPARRTEYHVAVRGPLIDAQTDEIIGHFLEEQRVRIQRGRTERLKYDFLPTECAIEIRVLREGKADNSAQITLRGDPSSLRYVRGGVGYLYLGKGGYDLLIGSRDRVICRSLRIESVDKPIPIILDLMDDSGIVFSDCPGAVEPYLTGDLATAAGELEAAGQDQIATSVRAERQRQLGNLDEAAAEFESAGRIEEAAELLAQSSDAIGAATRFEQAGSHARAAELYRTAQEFEAAGRCYEALYEYDSAVDCYRSADRTDKVVELLEKSGEYLEAGMLCRDTGDPDRALANFEQLSFRDGGYFEARTAMAAILRERGDVDLAIEKLGAAVSLASDEGIPIGILEELAGMLEQVDRKQALLETYEAISAREPHRAGLSDRIESLRQQLSTPPATRSDPDVSAGSMPTPRIEGRYETIEEIGRGGMGVVLKARDRELGRLVALKRLPDNLRDHPAAVALFRREAQAAAALNHRNIVTVYDAGEENGHYFITMELLEGQPLNAILKRQERLSALDVSRLGVQICAGLHYAHAQRIVHRDIKTANLFFTNDRTVKIMDFGLAKTLEEVRKNSTMIGGTPFFMAPEQAIGGELDHRADLYALGVTLFQLVTGSVPFEDGDLTYHHRHTPAPDPRERCADVPELLAKLILELLEKEPDDRPATAGEVGTRLQALVHAHKAARAT